MCHYPPQSVSKLNVYLALLGLELHYVLFSSCQDVVAACMSGYGGLVHGGYVSGFGGALVVHWWPGVVGMVHVMHALDDYRYGNQEGIPSHGDFHSSTLTLPCKHVTWLTRMRTYASMHPARTIAGALSRCRSRGPHKMEGYDNSLITVFRISFLLYYLVLQNLQTHANASFL